MTGCMAQMQKEAEMVKWLRDDTSIPACGRYCAQDLPNDFGLLPHSRNRNGSCRLAYYSRPGCRGGKIPTDQCEQLDTCYLGRMGYLESGTRFTLSWERADKEAGKIDARHRRTHVPLASGGRQRSRAPDPDFEHRL